MRKTLDEIKSLKGGSRKFNTPRGYFSGVEDLICKDIIDGVGNSDTLRDLRFVMRELIANASEHGNGRDPSKNIEIHYGWDQNNFYFVVIDEGLGFDVNNKNLGRPGSGLASAESLMDDVYNFGDNAVYVRKRC